MIILKLFAAIGFCFVVAMLGGALLRIASRNEQTTDEIIKRQQDWQS